MAYDLPAGLVQVGVAAEGIGFLASLALLPFAGTAFVRTRRWIARGAGAAVVTGLVFTFVYAGSADPCFDDGRSRLDFSGRIGRPLLVLAAIATAVAAAALWQGRQNESATVRRVLALVAACSVFALLLAAYFGLTVGH